MRQRPKRQPQRPRQTCQSQQGDWHDYLSENMDALGLMTPDTIFKGAALSIGTLKSLEAAYATFSGVEISALIYDGAVSITASEGLTIAAAGMAAFYTGALIGSMAVASQRSLTCGKRLSDYFAMMPQAGFTDAQIAKIKGVINDHPAIINPTLPNRKVFATRVRLAA